MLKEINVLEKVCIQLTKVADYYFTTLLIINTIA